MSDEERTQADESQESDAELTESDERYARLKNELDEQVHLAEERLNQLKYLQADFDNYRKKFDKEKEMIISLAEERLVTELLEILDDMGRMITTPPGTVDRDGLEMLYKNFFKILQGHGLKRIEATGAKFDPYYHEAFCVERCDGEEGTIIEEFQPGYMLKFKVIRPAKVKIAEKKVQQE